MNSYDQHLIYYMINVTIIITIISDISDITTIIVNQTANQHYYYGTMICSSNIARRGGSSTSLGSTTVRSVNQTTAIYVRIDIIQSILFC